MSLEAFERELEELRQGLAAREAQLEAMADVLSQVAATLASVQPQKADAVASWRDKLLGRAPGTERKPEAVLQQLRLLLDKIAKG